MRTGVWIAAALPQVFSLSLKPFSPNVYWPNEVVPLSVNKLFSHSHDTTYNYYDLPFVCQPEDGITRSTISMDEILRGDRLYASDYRLQMLENDPCHILCNKQMDRESIQRAHELIRKDYKVEWYVDGLPGATSFATHDRTHKYYASGFSLGSVLDHGRTFLNNHFTLVVKYRHSDNHDATRVILAFEVYPRSITTNGTDLSGGQGSESCKIALLQNVDSPPSLSLVNDDRSLKQSLNVTYTYSVYFREDLDVHWKGRWDPYFYYSDSRIFWYSTAISAIICILLTTVVGTILVRTLSLELSSVASPFKNEFDLLEDDLSGGWKTLRFDVMRTPHRPDLLTAFVGTGLQMAISLVALLIRSKISSSLGLFMLLFSCVYSGYYSGLIYKSFGLSQWQRQGVLTAIGIPSFLFAGILVLNFFSWFQSSSQVPFGTLVKMAGLWLGGSVPLVSIGVYTAARGPAAGKVMNNTRPVPRAVPRQPVFTRLWPSLLMAGALPYAAICVELYFILQASQLHQAGYLSFMFSSLSLVLLIAVVTTLEVTVAMVYLLLNHEDHRWHWRSFLYGSASAGYIFAHATFYFVTKLQYGPVSGVIYFGYASLFCLLYALVQGMLGYIVSSLFVAKIYGSFKAD